MSSKIASYVPRKEEMEVTLLNLEVTEGIHIANMSEVKKKWNTVNDMFFEQNKLLPF